jgi:hypothetical protein
MNFLQILLISLEIWNKLEESSMILELIKQKLRKSLKRFYESLKKHFTNEKDEKSRISKRIS